VQQIPTPEIQEAIVAKEASKSLSIPEGPINPDAEPETLFRVLRDVIETKNFEEFGPWFEGVIKTRELWLDLGLLAGSILFAWVTAHLLKKAYGAGKLPTFQKLTAKFQAQQRIFLFRLILVPTIWIVLAVANAMGLDCPVLRTFGLIATLFVFIHLPTRFFKWRLWMRIITTTLFVFAALHILGLLDDVSIFLDAQSVKLGSVRISILDIIKGFFAMVLCFWLAGIFAKIAGKRIAGVTEIAPRMQVLLSKLMSVGLYVLAVMLTLGVMGVDLAALTVFGGALALGLGFGLQKVVSNLVSGIILLLDKSIEPGDVVEIGDTYGWVNALNLRYASVITRDNKEHLIPNEDLITQPVINWSFSSELVRVRAPIGISYDSDVRLAIKLAKEAAAKIDRVVEQPAPVCNLLGFGDSTVDLELRFWINDPTNGVGNIRSQVLLEVWDSFKDSGVQFPFPQRDINFNEQQLEKIERLLGGRKSESKHEV